MLVPNPSAPSGPPPRAEYKRSTYVSTDDVDKHLTRVLRAALIEMFDAIEITVDDLPVDLYDRIGYSVSFVEFLISGRTQPTLAELAHIALKCDRELVVSSRAKPTPPQSETLPLDKAVANEPDPVAFYNQGCWY
jgi:hypothetical protein